MFPVNGRKRVKQAKMQASQAFNETTITHATQNYYDKCVLIE